MDRYDDEKLILPFLGPVYRGLAPIAWPLVRVVAGLNLVPHGAQKLFGWFGGKGLEATTQGFAQMGYEPAVLWVWLVDVYKRQDRDTRSRPATRRSRWAGDGRRRHRGKWRWPRPPAG